MLENEPDTNDTTAPPAEPAPTQTAAPVRRRRAASRPAGPPSSATDATPVQTLDIEVPPAEPILEPAAEPVPEQVAEPTAEVAAAVEPATPPAKKTARRTSKKAAAAPPPEGGTTEAAPEGGTTVPAPVARAPRKRAAKKTATPEPANTLPVEPSAGELSAGEPVAAEPLAEAAPASPVTETPLPAAAEAPSSIAAALAALAEQQSAEVVEAIELTELVDQPVTEEPAPEVPVEETSETEDTDPTAEAESEDDDDSGDGDGRRRRRRRGGRRRRRTGGDEDGSDSDDQPEATASDAPDAGGPAEPSESAESADSPEAEDESSSNEGDGDGEGDGSRRRRRRRRRRGEDAGSSADDPGEVVVRVREPRRQAKQPSNEVTGIEGSTRMEAKRQRRREGREAGRRRTPILSEAEFLARREAVARKMIIRQRDDLAQIAVIEDEILVEHYVDRDSATSLIGNVYLGRVQNVLPSMEAAFIDIGRGRNAVLYAGEVDWDSFGAEGQGRKVERVLKSGQTILVQVTKDPVGAKGARLTNNVSIPGRYIVYAPGGHLSGISRKLPENERKRLKDILADLVGESASVIVRTAAEGASEEELIRDVNRLKAQWEDIEKKVSAGQAPQLLYGEPDLTVRIVRDLFTEDFAELIIAGHGGAADAYDAVEAYVAHVAPHLADRLRRWDVDTDGDVFAAYRLDEQIAKGLERKVFLPSGGSLVIDRTEAMTVIDVNTGKFTGAGGNLEATVTSNNLEAAEEIVRQLRLRDIGGIIVIDFIDMVLPSNRELLLRRLVECLGRDRTRHQVAEITSLGLVQMTRKKIGTGLLEAFTSECPHCHGRGVELHELPVDSQKQADGGAREPRSRDRRGPAPIPKPQPPANGHGPVMESPAETTSDAAEDKPTRNRRGGRGRRGSGGGSTDDAPEPTSSESTSSEPTSAESPPPESTSPEPTPPESMFSEQANSEPAPPAEIAPADDPAGEPVPVS